jgi:hypothetical protein
MADLLSDVEVIIASGQRFRPMLPQSVGVTRSAPGFGSLVME